MPTYERSTWGCWSCRVRKKKCDENHPVCLICTSRGVTCHGYGSKPEWMDGGLQEKEVVNALKDELRKSQKQRRSLSSKKSTAQITTGPATVSPYEGFTLEGSTTEAFFNYASPPSTIIYPSPTSQKSNYQDLESQAPVASIARESKIVDRDARRSDHESTLLMNYLDAVFPLQFKCYVPAVPEFGRGWLLALLTRTKPLYHTALAMSAFYIKSILLKQGRDRSRCVSGHEEAIKTHHAIAFQKLVLQIAVLNRHKAEGTLKDRIEILACVIQLISFELLRSGTDSWVVHLRAAASFVPALAAARKTHNPSDKTLSADYTERMDRGDFPPNVDEIAADFLTGTVLWYDIMATASTRSTPFLQDTVNYVGNIELDKVMGCQNWVMVLIAEISALDNWKREMQKAGRLSTVDLSTRGSEIAHRLSSGMSTQKLGNPGPRALSKLPAKCSPLITQIFASSALTYLHVVVSGAYPELAEIKASVSLTIAALRNLPAPYLLQNLVWPFCVTGCLASRDYEPVLNVLVTAAGEEEEIPGSYWKAFDIIRECWRLREEVDPSNGQNVDWVTSMKSLGFQALLV